MSQRSITNTADVARDIAALCAQTDVQAALGVYVDMLLETHK